MPTKTGINMGLLFDEVDRQYLPPEEQNVLEWDTPGMKVRQDTDADGRVRIKASGVPEERKAPNKLDQISATASYWDEPEQQASANPYYPQWLEQARKDLSLKFSRMPHASLKDAERAIEETVAPYLEQAPELRGAIINSFRDKLPGRASAELKRVQASRDYLEGQRLMEDYQQETLQRHPGYMRDKTGRLVVIPQTAESKAEMDIRKKQSISEMQEQYQAERAQQLQESNPNIAIYNAGGLFNPDYRAVDVSNGTEIPSGWMLVSEAPTLVEAKKAKEAKKSKGGLWEGFKAKFGKQPEVAPETAPPAKKYRTAINPKTGETLVLIDNKWVKM
jgi:hypothetical protein